MEDRVFDIIVVGGGGSGLSTAVAAAERGAQVLVLEKTGQVGGTTGIAVGSFTANQTSFQKRSGITDSPDHHEEDAGKFGPAEIQQQNNTELRRYFLGEDAQTLEWLRSMGIQFHGPSPEPPNRVPRMHNVVPNAKAYITTLQSRFMRLGGTILCHAHAESLIRENNQVTGVEVRRFENLQTEPYTATKGVVLAAGDYTNSPELIGKYKGPEFTCIEGINTNSTGDGHHLAAQAGAKLLNMEITYGPEIRFIPPPRAPLTSHLPKKGWLAKTMGSLLPMVPQTLLNLAIKRLLVTWQHPEDSLFTDGAILINQQGQRFCNETASPDREIAIAKQDRKHAYILLDERLIRKYSEWPHFVSTAPEIAYAYVQDYLRLRPDVSIQAKSLTQLGPLRHFPAESVQETVKQFNEYAEGKADDAFGRSGDTQPLGGEKWVLLGPLKSYFTTTEGGAAIDQQLRVLDESGQAIQGLYAVGQNGLGGQVLWGHGLHIAWAITSGRLVGQHLTEGLSNPNTREEV